MATDIKIAPDSSEEPRPNTNTNLSRIFLEIGSDYSEAVVERALSFRSEASESVRSSLDAYIRDIVKIPGFQDASRAVPGQLKEPVLFQIIAGKNDKLAGAALRAWVESHLDLRNLIENYLNGIGIPVSYPNRKVYRFDSEWDRHDWIRMRDAVMDSHEDLDVDDVGLMLSWMSGRIPAPATEDALPKVESELMGVWLNELASLPPDSPDWEDIDSFVANLSQIASDKAAERARVQTDALENTLDEISSEFASELRYLDIDLASWIQRAKERTDIIPQMLALAAELKETLEEYRPIRPQAASRVEEMQRAEERAVSESAILDTVSRWERLLESSPVDSNHDSQDESEQGSSESALADTKTAALIRSRLSSENAKYRSLKLQFDQLDSELTEIRRDNDRIQAERRELIESKISKLESENARLQEIAKETQALEADIDRLESENAKLIQANSGLESDMSLRGSENSSLKSELLQSKEAEKYWREEYIAARSAGRPRETNGVPEQQMFSVNDALKYAEETFTDKLLFALNSKSEKNNQFQKPNEVFDALAWLATEYYRLRTNPGENPDFNKLIKETCPGWFYKPNQTVETMEQYADWYTASVNGKAYEISPHIGKGNSFDPQNTIRISFAWDGDIKRVIVGYIGRHQRNRQS